MSRLLDVVLDEASHIYSDSKNRRYDSATTIIGNYKEKFDPYKIQADGGTLIGNYVLKHGGTEQEWLDKWDENKNRACIKGSAFHKIKEDLANNADFLKHDLKLHPVQFFNTQVDRNPGIDYSQLPNGCYQELTLFNRRFMLAGQADKVVIEDGWVDIDDYKTNGKFEILSYKPKGGNYRMMKYPLNALMDCHIGHYTMQLSLYGWMLEQFGLKVRRLRVLHYQILDVDEQKILNGETVEHIEPTIYPITYKPELVERMVKDYVTNIRK